jgi:hypothetical protein
VRGEAAAQVPDAGYQRCLGNDGMFATAGVLVLGHHGNWQTRARQVRGRLSSAAGRGGQCGSGFVGLTGKLTWMCRPPSGRACASTSALWAVAMAATMERPSP